MRALAGPYSGQDLDRTYFELFGAPKFFNSRYRVLDIGDARWNDVHLWGPHVAGPSCE